MASVLFNVREVSQDVWVIDIGFCLAFERSLPRTVALKGSLAAKLDFFVIHTSE